MKNRHERVIDSAREWLSSVDREEFMAELLELQSESAGPTVNEFLSTFTISTNSLFDLVEMSEDYHFTEQKELQDIESLKVSKAIEKEVLHSFGFCSTMHSTKPVYKGKYLFKVTTADKIPHRFQAEDDICSFAEVA